MTTIYFIRHAHAPWVPNREAERPLSERGRVDAEHVADLLADRDIDAVVSSPYARAIQTVRPTADYHDLEIAIEEEFHERRLTDSSVESFGETFESAIEGVWNDWSFSWPDGESNLTAQERGVSALERTLEDHEDESVVVGTHGNLLTLVLNHYDDRFGFDFWNEELTMPDVYEAQFEGGEMVETECLYPIPN
ncbi:histidine phosphatase family protein [Haladaptatus sp. DFWS20]|uniref:histidine phosphatase family protein n=1 Tax=Haladaptatus sp. DFWS20 TaxID=3403467 RepID=UPI003EC1345D